MNFNLPEAVKGKLTSMIYPKYPSHAKDYETFRQKVNHISINYAKIGQGPPLVFIHGWTNNWEGWIPIIKYLQDDFTLYLLDLPGFGDSDNLPHYSIALASDYCMLLLKKLHLEAASAVGVSMGSFVAADMGYRYPEVVRSTILTGPVIKDGRNRIFPKTLDIFLRTVKKSKYSERVLKRMVETRAVAYFTGKYMNMYKFKKDIVDAYGMIGKQKVRKEAYVDMGISASRYDFTHTLKNISVPTLLVIGRNDRYTFVDYVTGKILPLNKNLKLAPVADAGHVVPWEKPKEVAATIRKFLKSV